MRSIDVPVGSVGSLVLGMELFTIGQHFNELSDLPRTSFRLFDVLNSEKDGISVLAVERGKECFSLFVGIEGLLQVIGDGRFTRWRIRTLPTTIFLGSVDFNHSSRSHSSCRNKGLGFCLVDLGPDTSGTSGRESLEPVVFALRLLLTINPAVAKRAFKRFGIGDRWSIGGSFCKAKPRTGCHASMEFKPGLPLGLIRKGECGIAH
jgi:hypothetical protein